MATEPKLERDFQAALDPRNVGTSLRAILAGGGAARVLASSMALFEAGGKLLLDEGAKSALRSALFAPSSKRSFPPASKSAIDDARTRAAPPPARIARRLVPTLRGSSAAWKSRSSFGSVAIESIVAPHE